MIYSIHRVPSLPETVLPPGAEAWSSAETGTIDQFHPRSSAHHPETRFRVLADDRSIQVAFHVRDRYVRSVHTNFMDPVCRDSCVEFFFRPAQTGPYFNFEFNAGGVLYASCVRDWRRTENGFADYEPLQPGEGRAVDIVSTLPPVIDPEETDPVEWSLSARIPLKVLAPYLSAPPDTAPGTRWSGNFYKCADQCSHPHWASWSPVGDVCNFHQPEKFSELVFRD